MNFESISSRLRLYKFDNYFTSKILFCLDLVQALIILEGEYLLSLWVIHNIFKRQYLTPWYLKGFKFSIITFKAYEVEYAFKINSFSSRYSKVNFDKLFMFKNIKSLNLLMFC